MPKMNLRRVLLGGLLAGLLCNVSGIALTLSLLHEEAARVFSSLEHPPAPGQMFVQHVSMRLALGFFAAWLYAAVRPRFGSGPRTAWIAGLFLWLAAYLLCGLMLQELEIYSWRATVLSQLWSLAEVVAMTQLAGWLYRESPLP